MQKAFDMDLDLGIYDVQKIGANPVLLLDPVPENRHTPMATIVAPNAKCQSCYHYQDQQSACAIGTQPSKCGIGDDAENGYAPLVMNDDAREAWKEKRKGTAAKPGRADAGALPQQPKAEFKIQILGDEKLELSVMSPLRKAEYQPPDSWLRFMSRQLSKSENPSLVAAGIWWSRMSALPPRFEKGLFQDMMTRLPTESEISKAEARTQQPEGFSKSEWRTRVIKGDADTPLSGNSSEKSPLRSMKAKSFYEDLKKKSSESASTYAKGRSGAAKKAAYSKKVATPEHESSSEELSPKEKASVKRPHPIRAAASALLRSDAKKSISVYDFRDTTDGKSAVLKGDELETYLQAFVEACAKEEFRDMRSDYECRWYKTNNGPKLANPGGVSTWGEVEAAKEIVNSRPPTYSPDYVEIARRVWQRLVAKIPANKNLLAAKRTLGVTQENVKMRLKSADFGV